MPETRVSNRKLKNISYRSQNMMSGKNRRWEPAYIVLSLLLGTMLWIAVDMKRMEEATIEIDLKFGSKISADWKLTAPLPKSVEVVITGSRQTISELNKDNIIIEPELPSGALDADVYEGMLTLSASQIKGKPKGVQINKIIPEVIPIKLARMTTKYINVEVGELVGTPANGYEVKRVYKPEPLALPIQAAKNLLDKVDSSDVIVTKPISIEGAKGLLGNMVELEPFVKDGVEIPVSGRVYVAVELVEKPVQRDLPDNIEVRLLVSEPFSQYLDATLFPQVVKVTVSGPQLSLDKITANDITVYVDARDRIPTTPGKYNIKCKSLSPDKINVIKIEPDTVQMLIKENSKADFGSNSRGNNSYNTPGNSDSVDVISKD